jgi:hypothetical protein
MGNSNVDSWWDIAGLLIISVPALIAAFASWHNRSQLKEVTKQVRNGHVVNFRDEVTAIGSQVDRLSTSLAELHTDMVVERHERRDSIKELREDMHDRFTAMTDHITFEGNPDNHRKRR